jgi:hypothetical protein
MNLRHCAKVVLPFYSQCRNAAVLGLTEIREDAGYAVFRTYEATVFGGKNTLVLGTDLVQVLPSATH